jgi:hypothetical protein
MGVAVIAGGGVGFFDFNSFLVDVTAAHVFDFGVGPSADVITVQAQTGAGNTSATAVLPGLHARLALNVNGKPNAEGRRSGFSVGLDLHPTFGHNGVILFTMCPGVGYEWF